MTQRTHSYRLHKPIGQAVVTLIGRDSYLGRHGSPASRDEYDRLLARWLANGRRSPNQGAGQVEASVDEVLLAFWRHAESHCKAHDGSTTSELLNFKHALKPLRALYGRTPAAWFGPLALRAGRDAMRSPVRGDSGRIPARDSDRAAPRDRRYSLDEDGRRPRHAWHRRGDAAAFTSRLVRSGLVPERLSGRATA